MEDHFSKRVIDDSATAIMNMDVNPKFLFASGGPDNRWRRRPNCLGAATVVIEVQ